MLIPHFYTDKIVQDFVNIICREKRRNELLDICSVYKLEDEDAFNFGYSLSQYIGIMNIKKDIYEFNANGIIVYFFGSLDEVSRMIHDIL